MVGDTRDRNAHEAFRHERHVAPHTNRLVSKRILRRGPIDEPFVVLRHVNVTQRLAYPYVCRLVGESNLIGAGCKRYAADEGR